MLMKLSLKNIISKSLLLLTTLLFLSLILSPKVAQADFTANLSIGSYSPAINPGGTFSVSYTFSLIYSGDPPSMGAQCNVSGAGINTVTGLVHSGQGTFSGSIDGVGPVGADANLTLSCREINAAAADQKTISANAMTMEVYAGACTSGTIHSSWTSVTGASSYRLKRGATVVYTGSGLSYADNNNGSGLTPNTSYTYTVEALRSDGVTMGTATGSATSPSGVCASASITNISPGNTSVATGASLPVTADFDWSGADYRMSFSITVTKPDNTTVTLTSISGPGNNCRTYPATACEPYSYAGSYTFSTPGTYTIRYHGLAKNSAQSVGAEPDYTRTVTVCNGRCDPEQFDFNLSNGGGVTVARNGSVGQIISAQLITPPTETVSFTNISSIPSGVTITMPASCSPDCSSNMTITASSNAALGTYPMTVTGTGGGKERTTTFNLTVAETAPPPPPPPGQSVVSVSSNVSSQWTITAVPLNGNPSYTLTGSGLSSSHNVSPGPAGTTYTISYQWPGGYCSVFVRNSVTVNGSSFTIFDGQSGSFSLEYLPCQSFTYSLSNSGTTNVSKSSRDEYGTNTITKTLTGGTAQAVDLTLSGVPNGVTYAISNRTCSPTCSSVITFTVSPGTPVGTHRINVTGSPNNVTTSFNLVVTASANVTATCVADPQVAEVGRPVTWTANVSGGEPPYTYRWSGDGIPANPAPSRNPYTVTYSTLGQKTAKAEVTDARGRRNECRDSTVQINFNPQFEEF